MLILTAFVALPCPAQTPADETAAVGPPRPGAEVDPDLQWLKPILQNSALPPEVRQGAAMRIVSRGSTDALRIIDEALRSGDAGQIDAVASAIDDEGRRRPSMLEALLVALSTSPKELHPKLARLLAREGDAAAEGAALVAMDSTRPAAERLGPIYAMGQLRGRDPLPDLMLLLDERRREPPEVIREACESLERNSGQRIGGNPDAWRQWWAARRSAPSQEFTIAALQQQVIQLQKRLDLEAERSAKLVTKLRDSYIDYFLALPVSDRTERILAMLEDELSDVRNLGLGQVERLLRNGERPADAVVVRVMDRLTDRVPSIRIRALRVLDDLASPRLAERVAEILPAESDSASAEAMMRLLAARPTAVAFNPVAARLSEPALAEVAAMAVNRLADANLAPAGWEMLVIEPVRHAVEQKSTPELVRLLAVAGTEDDRDVVARLLADPDEALRLGAAEGLRRAGRRRALIERAAADPAIYGPTVAAIADQPASAAVVGSLLDLPPRPDQAGAWNEAMSRVLKALPPRDLLIADERLAPLAWIDPRTRESGLREALLVPTNGSDGTVRSEILGRLADLLIAGGDGRAVLTLLSDEGSSTSVSLRPRIFRAAVLESEFDLAARMEPTAAAWLALLEALAPKSERSARPLANEISLRFAQELTASERERLATLERQITPAVDDG